MPEALWVILLRSEKFIKVAAGARGTVISASGFANVSKSGVTKGYSISGGKIEAYVKGTAKILLVGDKTIFDESIMVFNGWSS